MSKSTGAAAPGLIAGTRTNTSLEITTMAIAIKYAPKLPICLRVNTLFLIIGVLRRSVRTWFLNEQACAGCMPRAVGSVTRWGWHGRFFAAGLLDNFHAGTGAHASRARRHHGFQALQIAHPASGL